MKQQRTNISRIALSDMIHIARKDSVSRKTERPKTANNKVNLTQQTKRTSFIFIKNRDYIASDLKQYHRNMDFSKQNLQSNVYKNNYKAFPKRLLVKPHQRSSTSNYLPKAPESRKIDLTENTILFEMQEFSPIKLQMPPEKKEDVKKINYRSHRRTGSLHSCTRKTWQERNDIISPWQFPEHEQYKF